MTWRNPFPAQRCSKIERMIKNYPLKVFCFTRLQQMIPPNRTMKSASRPRDISGLRKIKTGASSLS
jgi:hypothetical protein